MDSGTSDPKVVALSGESHHANVEPSSNPEHAVAGTVFEITEQEIAAAKLDPFVT